MNITGQHQSHRRDVSDPPLRGRIFVKLDRKYIDAHDVMKPIETQTSYLHWNVIKMTSCAILGGFNWSDKIFSNRFNMKK